MPKFKKTRDTISEVITEKEQEILHGADETPFYGQTSSTKKQVATTLPLSVSDKLDAIAKREDRSKRYIIAKLLTESINDYFKKNNL